MNSKNNFNYGAMNTGYKHINNNQIQSSTGRDGYSNNYGGTGSNMMKTNNTGLTGMTGMTTNTFLNQESRQNITMKKQISMLENFVKNLKDEFDNNKVFLNKLNLEQSNANERIQKNLREISENINESLLESDKKIDDDFKKQDNYNVTIQMEINEEKIKLMDRQKYYLSLVSRLSHLYSHVGLEDPNLDMNK